MNPSRSATLAAALALAACLAAPAPGVAAGPVPTDERPEIERTIRASIGWAQTKDRALLESVIAHDPELFIIHPTQGTDVRGWDAFAKLFDFWMDPRFVATRVDVRDLHVNLSRGGDVAWFDAVLDDCSTWDGKPGCWNDTRWTGVLERRDGRWQIVQMHFSFAAPRPRPAAAEPGE